MVGIQRGIAVRREGEPVRCGDHQAAARSQHPAAFGEKARLVPEMLDHLEVRHHIHRCGGQRKEGEISPDCAHLGITPRHVRDGWFVVVQCEHPPGHLGDQSGAVALTAARLQHGRTCAVGQQCPVRRFVPPEPVVLLGDPGHGSLAGQVQRFR